VFATNCDPPLAGKWSSGLYFGLIEESDQPLQGNAVAASLLAKVQCPNETDFVKEQK
jgi:hypothetical protein